MLKYTPFTTLKYFLDYFKSPKLSCEYLDKSLGGRGKGFKAESIWKNLTVIKAHTHYLLACNFGFFFKKKLIVWDLAIKIGMFY